MSCKVTYVSRILTLILLNYNAHVLHVSVTVTDCWANDTIGDYQSTNRVIGPIIVMKP